jgi:DMSO reductase family type II enzyme chaperone
MTARQTATHAATQRERRALAAQRAFARSAIYRLLSQTLVYPSKEGASALRDADLPAALALAPALDDELAAAMVQLGRELEGRSETALQEAHRRVFLHVESGNCPSHETAYTAQNIFQETEVLSDLAGFFRAFGLELAQRERPDHISVELEFMYVLTYKEAYALLHHGGEKARFCRTVQRKFMDDHLGRWAPRFVTLLARNAEDGHLQAAAILAQAFLDQEIALLRARPDAISVRPVIEAPAPEDFVCPLAEDCAMADAGGQDAPQ